jgi:hypothetical protein
MRTFLRLLLISSLIGIIFGCATSTQLRKSWSDPSLAKNPVKPFNKVMVIVKAKTDLAKKTAEDELVALLRKGAGVPSYSYLSPSDTSQKELVEKLIKDGFDGVIMMRVKAVVQTQTTSSNPGTSYSSWYAYSTPYGYGYGYSVNLGPADPDAPSKVDVNSAKDYMIETNIYSLESKKLLWSGITASMSAKKIEPAMKGIVDTIKKELKKKGFVKE